MTAGYMLTPAKRGEIPVRARLLEALALPPDFWRSDTLLDALTVRDVGHLFRLVQKVTGASQTQIGIAYESVPRGHPEYYNALGAVNVLDGGMSARLFTEVREKHGLCYSISASYQTFKDRASILCYAGTTTPQLLTDEVHDCHQR